MRNNESKQLGRIVAIWWRALHPDEEGGRGDRAAAARLRRASTLHEVMVVQEAMRLHGLLRDAMGCEKMSAERFEAFCNGVAILAGVLAAVEPGAPDYTPFASMLGRTADGKRPGETERPLFSPLRFAALVRADDPQERLRHLRRAAALAHRKSFDVARFAEDILHWNDATRRRWIFEYHQQGRAAPVDDDKIEEGITQ